MALVEINFDGIIGPSHNYAGLSLGNLASAKNAKGTSQPRAAALQGLDKMRANLALGLTQGVFMPQSRPDHLWLDALGLTMETADPAMRANAFSASSMWAANAATVTPAPDSSDAHEWQGTLAQLRLAFAKPHFAVHGPVPAPFGDEGAANHMRLCAHHGAAGVEVFVYGTSGGPFPARQHIQASKAVARRHHVNRAVFVQQSEAAIAAGAFHNDVVAVANEQVLFAHELGFAQKDDFYRDLRALMPQVDIIEVPDSAVSLADAIQSYLFNAQLVTLPEGGGMALILPSEAQDHPRVWAWLQSLIAGNGPIQRLIPVDVRQSMANGGGPACLRLRVVCDPASVDPRFIIDTAKLDAFSEVVTRHWPERIDPADIDHPALWNDVSQARAALLTAAGLEEFLSV
jgi:succinylarginine dihydrolase